MPAMQQKVADNNDEMAEHGHPAVHAIDDAFKFGLSPEKKRSSSSPLNGLVNDYSLLHDHQGLKSRENYAKDVVDLLKNWLIQHAIDPYPSEGEKDVMCAKTGLRRDQLNNWFVNARRRLLPRMTCESTRTSVDSVCHKTE
jgi:hypothetical protein